MKTTKVFFFYSFFALLFLSSCVSDDTVNPIPPIEPGVYNFSNEEIIGGGQSSTNSYRNNHYLLEVGATNAIVNIELNMTGAEGRIYVLNSARTSVSASNVASEIEQTNLSLSVAGTYYVVINSPSNANSTYDLKIQGDDITSVTRINNSKIIATGLEWTNGGGIAAFDSYSNGQMKFEVIEDNTYIDIVAESRNAEIRFYLLNSARTSITSSFTSITPELSQILIPNAGTYYLTGNTDINSSGDFDITIYGKEGSISNLEVIESVRYCIDGSWTQAGGIAQSQSPNNPRFTFTVAEPITIDLLTESAGTTHRFYLMDSAGGSITSTSTAASNSKVAISIDTPGTYTVAMTAPENNSGSFELCLVSRQGAVSELIPE